MADTKVITRAGNAAPLGTTEHDQNHDSFAGVVEQWTIAGTVDHNDQNKTIECSSTSAFTVTLEAITTLIGNADTTNFTVTIKNVNTGLITIAANAADDIDGLASITLGNGNAITLQTDSANSVWKRIANYAPIVPGRNYIINGAFDIWQRGTSFTITGTAGAVKDFTADRVGVNHRTAAATGVVTVSQSTTTPSGVGTEFNYSLKALVSTQSGAAAASDYLALHLPVEGYDYAKFANASSITVSFYVRASSTGPYHATIRNGNPGTRSYTHAFTLGGADTWERVSFSVPMTHADKVSGTWATDNSLGMTLDIVLQAGTDLQDGTADTWVTTNELATSTQVDWWNIASADFYITGVKIEVGSTATNFTTAGANIAEELAMCQRYFEKSYNINVAPGTAESNPDGCLVNRASRTAAGAQTMDGFRFTTQKRAVPSMTWYATDSGNSGNTHLNGTGDRVAGDAYVGHTGASLTATNIADGDLILTHWTASAEL